MDGRYGRYGRYIKELMLRGGQFWQGGLAETAAGTTRQTTAGAARPPYQKPAKRLAAA
jgi:hypothetical protein